MFDVLNLGDYILEQVSSTTLTDVTRCPKQGIGLWWNTMDYISSNKLRLWDSTIFGDNVFENPQSCRR